MTEQAIDTRHLGWEVIQGNALDVLPGMPAGSVDCIVTSPPYWGLRDYGEETVIDWPDGWRGQLGGEPQPSLFLDHLWAIFDECRHVLKPTGCCFVNMGDTYCSLKGTRQKYGADHGKHAGAKAAGATIMNAPNAGDIPREDRNWLKPKNLLMIPARFAIGMSDRGWWIRNDNAWVKPNAMCESVKSRFSCRWEHVFFFQKEQDCWFDLDAVREAYIPQHSGPSAWRSGVGGQSPHSGLAAFEERRKQTDPAKGSQFHLGKTAEHQQRRASEKDREYSPLGKNPGDVFTVSTIPFPSVHFAVYPPKLIRPLIRAGCPPKVCVQCGAPWQRITEEEREPRGDAFGKREPGEGLDHGQAGSAYQQVVERKTIGWEPTCECGPEAGTEPGLLLDPFVGSGTSGIVAREELRRFIGIDLSPAYCHMSTRRLSELLPL